MSREMRKNFTDSVICLQTLPPQVMTEEEAPSYPGIRTRYDEYLATHINLTLFIHDTADFLAWHRFYIHSFEQDLRNLCGYTGYLPYWNWPDYATAPQSNPMFNGDEYSMGSDGYFIPSRGPLYHSYQNVTAPPGTGGGCVEKGPFSDYIIHMGPLFTENTTSAYSAFAYNPHCIVRDLNEWLSKWSSWEHTTNLILQNPDIATFQGVMQGDRTYVDAGFFGVHGGGHFTPGSTGTMGDFYASVGDPLFFLHHAMIDRVWTIWQGIDWPVRKTQIYGTSTLRNLVPSANMTLEDEISFGFVAGKQRFGDLMSTFEGPYCYYYV